MPPGLSLELLRLAALPPGALVEARELSLRRPTRLPTGLDALDALLGGGIPAGRITELASARGGGTALALTLAARLTREGRLVALVDGADALDPRSAAGAGVDLQRLLWVRPTSGKASAKATDAILRSGAFALAILDLPPRASLPQASWVRLAHVAEESRTALLSLAPATARGGGASFSAALALTLRRLRTSYEGRGPGRTLEGFSARVELSRSKLGHAQGSVELSWRVPELFPPAPE
ncbi:MAG: hypothetical protein ACYCWW_12610 [Deltaproteobacteria bacterium]